MGETVLAEQQKEAREWTAKVHCPSWRCTVCEELRKAVLPLIQSRDEARAERDNWKASVEDELAENLRLFGELGITKEALDGESEKCSSRVLADAVRLIQAKAESECLLADRLAVELAEAQVVLDMVLDSAAAKFHADVLSGIEAALSAYRASREKP